MEVKAKIIDILTRARDKIVQKIDSQGIRASGRTQESLKVEDRGESIVLVQEADEKSAPFETLQFGRPGGSVPMGFAGIIRQWIIDKGIQTDPIPYKRAATARWQPKYTADERGLMAAAGAIAEKIRKVGTDRNASPNMNVYTEPINGAVDELAEMLMDLIVTEVKVRR
jgi:hypothetical protein